MKITYDTNIFVNALINNNYKNAIVDLINKKNSFLPITLNHEIRNKLLKVHTILIKISYNNEMDKQEFKNYCDDPDLIELKEEFSNLYEFLIGLKEDKKIGDKVDIMADISTSILMELNKIKLYPSEEYEINSILSKMENKLNKLKEEINNLSDIKHLLLSEAYTEVSSENECYFISNDYKDIINNKDKIEKILKFVKVFDFKSFLPVQ